MSKAFDEYRELARQGKYKQAAELAERENLLAPATGAFWLTQQASALARASDYDAAYKTARQALEREPANPYTVLVAADALLGLGRVEEALGHYEECLDNERVSGRALRGTLDCLARSKRWQDILVRLSGSEAGAGGDEIGYKVKALAGLGKIEEAMSECRRWLERKPDHPRALWALVELEVESDGLENTLARYAKMARIPSLPPVYKEIHASLCRRAGRPERALEEYEKLAASGTNKGVQRQQAFTLAKTGREREAIPLFEELLRADPRNVFLHSGYTGACKRTGDLERALNFYNRLLDLHPDEKGLYGRITKLTRLVETGK